MISFKHRSNTKRIKIKTNKRLDQRMSSWLQKVFSIKNQIIGFKSSDNKYYDVETFYMLIDRFYNTQVQIVEGSDQLQISFTSDNLNSSSFIRPNQPNTSQINQKGSNDSVDDLIFVSDMKAFEKKLLEGRQCSVLFDIHPGFKREIVEAANELSHPYPGTKASIYILLNNSAPKKSNFSIYVGRVCVVMIPLTAQFKTIIINALAKCKKGIVVEQGRTVKLEDEAPSFTTYHLQERLNQEACMDYLTRMNREKLLSNYEYHKMIERLEDNFNQFYRIFCESVLDNDYESFKQQIRSKVQNNLEMLLSNVDEMDLSRPISRQQQRKQNLRKSVPDIEIVKVQNYFQVLDLIKDKIDSKYMGQIKQNLLDQNQELCTHFSKFLSRDIGKDQLTKRLTAFAKERCEDLRPISRCVARETTRAKSTQCVRKRQQVRDELDMDMQVRDDLDMQVQLPEPEFKVEEAPMFGSMQPAHHVSPIKTMSDIESNYKQAWDKLSKLDNQFAPQQYGLLYHYLQNRDDCISNLIQQMNQQNSIELQPLRMFLKQKITVKMNENFSQSQISYLQSIRNTPNISSIFDNFKYQCDVQAFIAALREEINKGKPQLERILHKKSSDSQLLDNNKNVWHPRKYSDQKPEQQPHSPSPKASDMSLNPKQSQRQFINFRLPWAEQFAEMLEFCDFHDKQKVFYLSERYRLGNPSLFLCVRDFLNNKESQKLTSQQFRQRIEMKTCQLSRILNAVPFFSELMREFHDEGKITFQMRRWAVFSFLQPYAPLVGAFQLYLVQKDEDQLLQSLKLAYENDSQQIQLYRFFQARIQQLLKEMCVHNEASMQIFRFYPQKIKAIIDVFYFTGNFDDMMQNLDLLQSYQVKQSQVHVATLNFSGINTNPFQYDDGSPLFDQINSNIKQLISREYPTLTDWKIGKIDKQYNTEERHSVGFCQNLQTIDNCLLNRQQYEVIWRKWFDKSTIKQKQKIKQQQIVECIKMDHIFYMALIKTIYKIQSYQELDKQLKNLPAGQLNSFLQQKFNRPASKLNIKQDLVIEYIIRTKLDVLCLQEAGTINWKQELIPAYGVHKNHDSVIIYNKQKFGQIKTDYMEKYGKTLDINNDTAFLFTNKNYLIISGHLKSKKEIYVKQAEQLFVVLKTLSDAHPTLKIVLGMDSNHFVDQKHLYNSEGTQIFYIAPTSTEKPTTVKQRSFMQAQFNKGGIQVSQVKDHIASNRKISSFAIENINGEQSQNQLLPNDIHPYDHYLVAATIDFL